MIKLHLIKAGYDSAEFKGTDVRVNISNILYMKRMYTEAKTQHTTIVFSDKASVDVWETLEEIEDILTFPD